MLRPGIALRALLLLYLAYAGVRQIADWEYAGPFAGIIFGVHELGHLVFGMLGEWIGVAGGSLAQLLLPLAAGALFWKQRDRFAVAVCGCWLAISMASLCPYIADARAQELTLVSFSEEGAIHDWNYLLSSMGLLRDDMQIARFTGFVAALVLAASAFAGAREVVRLARLAPPR
jgi:hypothetical protein